MDGIFDFQKDKSMSHIIVSSTIFHFMHELKKKRTRHVFLILILICELGYFLSLCIAFNFFRKKNFSSNYNKNTLPNVNDKLKTPQNIHNHFP